MVPLNKIMLAAVVASLLGCGTVAGMIALRKDGSVGVIMETEPFPYRLDGLCGLLCETVILSEVL